MGLGLLLVAKRFIDAVGAFVGILSKSGVKNVEIAHGCNEFSELGCFLWRWHFYGVTFVVRKGVNEQFFDGMAHFLQADHLGVKLVNVALVYFFDFVFSFDEGFGFFVVNVYFSAKA